MMVLLISLKTVSATELWMKVGESRSLPASAAAVVRVGSRGIVRAVESDSGILLIGLKDGITSLAIDNKSYLIRVSTSSEKDFGFALQKVIREMMGLKLHVDQKQLLVTGRLLRFSDWLKIADVARQYNGHYIFGATPLPDVAETALSYFRNLAERNKLPNVRFSTAAGRLNALIPQSAQGLRAAVERAYKPFGITLDISGGELNVAPLVRTRVILAEVSKSYSQELGFRWPAEYKAQLLPTFEGSDEVITTLRALEARGQAQILSSPTLLCRSGGQAQFHAGGEFPIRVFSRNSREVIWKAHGVILNVKPTADYQGAISLELETEISLLDMANAVDGIPAVKKNRVKSHFDLTGRKTVALSGLIRQEMGDSREGLPFLARIPVLGSLFSSRKFLNHETELVVFVTPEIYEAKADEVIQMPEGWTARAN